MLPPQCPLARDITSSDLAIMAVPFDPANLQEQLTWLLGSHKCRQHGLKAAAAAEAARYESVQEVLLIHYQDPACDAQLSAPEMPLLANNSYQELILLFAA